MPYTPVAQRKAPSGTGYVPVAQRDAEEPRDTPKRAPLAFQQPTTDTAVSTPQVPTGPGTTDIIRALGQGIGAEYLAAGEFVRSRLEGKTLKEAAQSSFKFEKDTKFGKFTQAIAGTDEPVSLAEQDVEFLGLFGEGGEKLGEKTGGLVTGLFLGLDLLGGGGLRGIRGLTEVVTKADNADEVSVFMKNAGFADDVVEQYAPLLAREKNAEKVSEGLRAAERLQNETKPKTYRPVSERAERRAVEPTDGIPPQLAEEARKFDTAEEFVEAQPKLFHGTTREFDEFKSLRQLQDEGADVAPSNVAGRSPFVHLSEREEVARNFGRARVRVPGEAGKVFIKEGVITGKVLDTTSDADSALLKEVGDELWNRSGGRGHDARIAGELIEASKGKRTPNIGFIDIEQSDILPILMKEKGLGGLKFTDRTTFGGHINTIAALPDAVKTKSQLTDIFNRVKGRSAEVPKTIVPDDIPREVDIKKYSVPSQRTARAFGESAGQTKIQSDLADFEVGSFGRAAFERKATQADRFALSEVPKAIEETFLVIPASNNPKNWRFDNMVFLSRQGDGLRAVYARPNKNGALEIINAHDIPEGNINKYFEDISSIPSRTRTDMTSLENSQFIRLAYGDTLSVPKQINRVKKEGGGIFNVAGAPSSTRRRRNLIRAAQEQWGLTDAEVKKLTNRREISLMTDFEFKKFIDDIRRKAQSVVERRNAHIQLEALIQERNFQKWENVRDVLKLPKSLSKMSLEDIRKLTTVLERYKAGDEFLPVRMMETIPNTRLGNVRTVREVLEILAKEKGLTVAQVSKLKPTELHRFMKDNILARQHPFYEHIVTMKNRAFLEANARILELSDKADDLIRKARKSKPRGVAGRLVPTDESIIRWLEAEPAERATIARSMTPEELTSARFMDDTFRAYYEYLVKKQAEKKFSRFEDKYFPHVRRGFLEAWKEDSFLGAFKEMRNKFKQDQKYLDILNERTGDILPYEKWIGFTQFRTENLIPTKNAARAFESYVTALERGRHLDQLVPEMMAYVHALSPRRLSERGLELDTSLKRFVKEWVNANKGRVPKGFFEPGGKMDWSLRMSVALTRILDLGFNFTTQIAAPIGEQVMNLTMLKPKQYSIGVARARTKQGKEIVKKYRNFTGRTFFDDLTRSANNAGDVLLGGMFAVFSAAVKGGNNLFLLGKLTPEEFRTGEVSLDRLTEIHLEMSKYRAVRGIESIMGRTGEADAFKQYKSWAIPIITATATNARDLARMVRTQGAAKALSSDAGKELFYSIGMGTAIGVGAYGYYTELGQKRERTFIEDMQYKAMRDSLSMLGALDPSLWSSIRVADFLDDIATGLTDTVLLDRYKTTGELKGPRQLLRTITPAPIRQIQREVGRDEPEAPSRTGRVKVPEGLPDVPSADFNLPVPEGLPELPSI